MWECFFFKCWKFNLWFWERCKRFWFVWFIIFLDKKMLKENFLKFDSIEKLHLELANIMLISSESSNYFYCYCKNDGKQCDFCDLVHFLCSTENLMDGLPPVKFLKFYHFSIEKLESFRDRIFPFFWKDWSQL